MAGEAVLVGAPPVTVQLTLLGEDKRQAWLKGYADGLVDNLEPYRVAPDMRQLYHRGYTRAQARKAAMRATGGAP